jgi:hypothetical protein
MIRATFEVAGWLALGGSVSAGLYWLFLNTPESNALTLSSSVALVLIMLATTALTVNGAILRAWGHASRQAMRTALKGIPWFIVSAIPVVIAWLGVAQADAWVERHNGEISAWFIARFGWADVTPLFRVELWLSRWIRWVVVPIAALCLLAALLQEGRRALTGTGWIRHALHWRTLVVASLVVFLLVALPWRLTGWRPALQGTWVQPAAAGLRLGTGALLALIGCALLVRLTVATARSRAPGSPTGAERE